MKKMSLKYKWIGTLCTVFLLIGLYSCDKDSYQERNFIQEPFAVNNLKLSNQLFAVDSVDNALTIESIQANRQIGYIQQSAIEVETIDELSYELTFAIDPKKIEVEFEFGEVVMTFSNGDDSTTYPLIMKEINTRLEREYAYVTYEIKIEQSGLSFSKEDFKNASFLVKANYIAKKGKKDSDSRSMRFVFYTKS